MQMLISGSHGLIGSALLPRLMAEGHQVRRLVRDREPRDDAEVRWNTQRGQMDMGAVKDTEAVVHLAGESIAKGRWNLAKKSRIRDSRVTATRLLCEALADLPEPPRVMICASAVGYYGDRGAERLTERSAAGTGFLAEVGQAWETATAVAHEAGIRVVHIRLGMVLSRNGGALAKMLPPFRWGVGGIIGHGRQYWNWITLEDVIRVILFALHTPSLSGPVNTVTPEVVTNRQFTQALGSVVRRPTMCPMPAFVVRALFGEMGQELLLASTRAEPERLTAAGYQFQYPQLDGALRAVIQP